VTIPVLANDGDPDGDPLTITGVTAPATGSVSISGGSLVCTPVVNFNGTVVFGYTISDRRGGTASATVTVAVHDVTPPQVLEVKVRGTTWAIPAYNIPVGTGEQLRTLPWVNVNQVSIRFGENVSIPAGALTVNGVAVPSYPILGFGYSPTTHTATWTLARPILKDKVLL
jgi:hypothetical protein